MAGVARAVGVLVFGLSVLGLFVSLFGLEPPAPLWSDQPWTAVARRAAEWAAYAALAVGGLALRARPDLAVWPLLAAVILAGAKLGYDFAVSDPELTRHQTMVLGDLLFAVVAAVAIFAQLLAEDENSGDQDGDRKSGPESELARAPSTAAD